MLRAIAELTKALAWPIVIIVLLLLFWDPLYASLNVVPEVLSKSEELSVGGVTFHLRKSLLDRASPDVKRILADLGYDEIKLVLEVKPQDIVCFGQVPSPGAKQPYTNLVKLGMFADVTKEEAKQQESEGYPCVYGVRTTPVFGRIREFMIAAISDAIEQSKTLPASKPTTILKPG